MNKEKATILIYHDWAPMLEELEDYEVGQLFKAIYKEWDGKGYGMQSNLKPILKFMLSKIESNEEAYEDAKQRRIEGRRKQIERDSKNLKSLKETSSQLKSVKPTVTDTVTVTVTDTVSTNVDVKEKETKVSKEKSSRFSPPSLEDVQAYVFEKGLSVDPEGFIDYYTAKGWKIGSAPMKDWKAAVRNWDRRDKHTQTPSTPSPIAYLDEGKTELERLKKEAGLI